MIIEKQIEFLIKMMEETEETRRKLDVLFEKLDNIDIGAFCKSIESWEKQMSDDVRKEVANWVAEKRKDGMTWLELQYSFELEASRLSKMFFDYLMKPYAVIDMCSLEKRAEAFQKRYGAFVDVWFECGRERTEA